MERPTNHYDVLQVSPWASAEVVEAAYLALMARWEGTPAGEAIAVAGRVLLSPDARRRYDAEAGLGGPPDGFADLFDVAMDSGGDTPVRRVGDLDGMPLYRIEGTQRHVLQDGRPVSATRLAEAARRGTLRLYGTRRAVVGGVKSRP